jgi:hypothetical protein
MVEMGRKLSPGNVVVKGGALAGDSPRSGLRPEIKEEPPYPVCRLCELVGAPLGEASFVVMMVRAGPCCWMLS